MVTLKCNRRDPFLSYLYLFIFICQKKQTTVQGCTSQLKIRYVKCDQTLPRVVLQILGKKNICFGDYVGTHSPAVSTGTNKRPNSSSAVEPKPWKTQMQLNKFHVFNLEQSCRLSVVEIKLNLISVHLDVNKLVS